MDNKENKGFKIDLDNTEVDLSPLDLNKEKLKDAKNERRKKEDTKDNIKKESSGLDIYTENNQRIRKSVDSAKKDKEYRKKAIPFIAHILGIIFISMIGFGVLQIPNLNITEFYNSTRFNEILREYDNNVMEYVVNTRDGVYEQLDKQQEEYDVKVAEIEKKYEDKKERYIEEYKTNYLDADFEYIWQNDREMELNKVSEEIWGENGWGYDYRKEVRDIALKRYNNLKFYVVDKATGNFYTNIENLNNENFSEEYLKNNSQFLISIKGNSDTGISDVVSHLDEKVFKRYYDLYFNSARYKDFDVYYTVPSVIRLHDEIYNIIKSYENEINSDIIYGMLITGVVGTSIYLIYLIIRRKRLFNEGLLDRIYRELYTEIKLGLTCGGVLIVAILFCEVVNIFWGDYNYYYSYYDRILMRAIFVLGILELTVMILLFNIKYMKNSENTFNDILNRSIIFRCTKWGYRFTIKAIRIIPSKFKRAIEVSYFQGNKVYRYWIAIGLGGATIVGGGILTLFCIIDSDFALWILPASIIIGASIIYLVIYYMDSLQEVVKATDDICSGNFNVNVQEKGDFVTKKLAHNINNINNGLKVAVDNEIRSERMRGELITNVSHDLKTPLTSIINYVDLLKDERATEEEKKKYIEILERKSQRLKVLIEDLFEVSKATSGTMELNMEEVEVSALLRQAFGELKEKIDSSSVSFRTKFSDKKVYSKLDGNKTWRVFENLLVNILKYSLPGSRAYIELNDLGEHVQIVMKNTSQEELAFTSDEIVERFKRGDSARNTEGSGLGLAISKSIVELQGGTFSIDIDGDLFKVTITFDTVNK